MKRATLVVLSSPSGGGKTTICRRILKKHKDYLYSVSATTREKRRNEREGKDYFFLSLSRFRATIKRRGFAEWARVHGEYYGTLKKYVDQAEREGRVALFILDVQGGMAMKKKYPESILIFLLPPSLRELQRRLIGRGTDKKDEVKRRLETALKEVKFWSKYDYVVINNELGETARLVEKIIQAERQRSFRFDFKKWNRRAEFPLGHSGT